MIEHDVLQSDYVMQSNCMLFEHKEGEAQEWP